MIRFQLLILTFAVGVSAGAPSTAAAQEESPRERAAGQLLLPSPLAAVDGPRALDVNPAALAFRTPLSAELAVASGRPASGLVGLGGYAGGSWFAGGGQGTFDESGRAGHAVVGVGAPIAEGLGLGGALRLHWPGGGARPYLAGDVGIALRPTSWLSLAGAARDLAVYRDEPGRYSPTVGAGFALRPFGRRFTIALDWRYETAAPPEPHHLAVTALVEPVDGVRLHAAVDEHAGMSFGLQLAFSAGWIGGQARVSSPVDPGFEGWTAGVGISAAQQPTRLVVSRSVAEFRIGATVENPTTNPLAPRRTPARFADLLMALREAGERPSVRAVLLRLDGYGGGLARAEELRAEIRRIRDSGKPVYAYLEAGGANVDYYLASACDQVWMHPGGTLAITGLSTRLFHYRGTLDRLGVEAQFSRIGRYKSSPEQYTETRPTDANLEVRNALLDDRFDRWLDALASGRGVDAGRMRALVDDAPYPASLARDEGLVDALLYPDEVRARAREEAGGTRRLGVREPLNETKLSPHWRPPHGIAVIHVDGLINTGPSGRLPFGLLEVAGSDTLARTIRRAREDRTIEAIVLRVDSPGGSAFASEAIWREVRRTRGVKPVVVSMASVAASGGYFVSCSADRILADPSTITGSIGVFAGKVSLAGLYDRLGVTAIRLRRGDHAGMYALAEPWSASEYRAVERIVDHLYADFVEHVREGRGAEDAADIDRVAQGRVWTGQQALGVGLVDELGGLMDAVAAARELAGIRPRAEVQLMPMPRVGLLSSIEIGKGFVRGEAPAEALPDELRRVLSGLVLMELQPGRTPAMMLMTDLEATD